MAPRLRLFALPVGNAISKRLRPESDAERFAVALVARPLRHQLFLTQS